MCLPYYLLSVCHPFRVNIILVSHIQGFRFALPLPVIYQPLGLCCNTIYSYIQTKAIGANSLILRLTISRLINYLTSLGAGTSSSPPS